MKRELRMAVWEITDACNLDCKHCYKRMISSSNEEYIDEVDIEYLLNEMKSLGLKTLVISGGEPILKLRTVTHLINICNELGIETILTSNGTLLNEKYVDALKNKGLSSIQISLDGVDGPAHDCIRGDGTFKKTIEAIELCVKKGLSVTIMTVPTIYSMDDLDELYSLACYLHVNCLGIERPIASTFKSEYYFDSDNLKRLHEKIENLEKRGHVKIHCNDPIYQIRKLSNTISNISLIKEVGDMLHCGCSSCTSSCVISSNGVVRACTFVDYRIGDLRRDSFTNIWNSKEKAAVCDRTSKFGKCSGCTYFNICKGCFAQRIALGYSLEGSDESCYLRSISF